MLHTHRTQRRERDRVVAAAEEELTAWQLAVLEVIEATGAMQAEAAMALEEAGGSVAQAASLVLMWEESRLSRGRVGSTPGHQSKSPLS